MKFREIERRKEKKSVTKIDDVNDTKIKIKKTKIIIFLHLFTDFFIAKKTSKSARKTVIRALREFTFFAREQKS